jgi:hypothetical protein
MRWIGRAKSVLVWLARAGVCIVGDRLVYWCPPFQLLAPRDFRFCLETRSGGGGPPAHEPGTSPATTGAAAVSCLLSPPSIVKF